MTLTRKGVVMASILALSASAGCNSAFDEGEPSAEADYNQTEVMPVMEEALAETVEGIPDFPGFHERQWTESSCLGGFKGQESFDEFVELKITYHLGEEYFDDSETSEAIADVLRDHWVGMGFEISQDRETGTGEFETLSAERDDGVTLSFNGVGKLNFSAYVGCVDRTDEWDFVPPLDGVEPENDRALEYQ